MSFLTPSERQRWWRSLRWSSGVHLSLLLVLTVQALWLPLPNFQPESSARQEVSEVQPEISPVELEVDVQIEERRWIARDAEDPTYSQIDLNDPRWDDILTEPARHAEGLRETEDDVAATALISEQLRKSIESSSQQSAQSNLDNLEQLSGRLNDVSSEETIDELSGTLGRLTGTRERATKPKEGVAGEFDHSTAQPHDCRKEDLADGKVKYVVIMIDAQGRTQEVEVDEATGEQLYKTMQLVKSNPLLEQVYRGVVMSLMDQMLKPQSPK